MKNSLTIFLLVTCGVCFGQNLVPNPSFEDTIACPTWSAQLNYATGWINPTSGTPDYFNQCHNSGNVGVPNNVRGFQYAHSGVAYGGLIPWWGGGDNREYIEINLLSPLVANVCYHFEMYVSAGDNYKYTTYCIGAYFSDTLISGISNNTPLLVTPQVINISGNIFDALNWTLVSDNYTAIGGESFLVIGNFNDDVNTPLTLINNSAPLTQSYFYIDDVSLSVCTGISELSNNAFDNPYPNPFTNELFVKTNANELSEIILYDISSRKILEQSFTNSTTINTEQLANGIYFYALRNAKGTLKTGKVVKQ